MSEPLDFKSNSIGEKRKRIMLPFLAAFNVEYICSVDRQLVDLEKQNNLSKKQVSEIKQNLDFPAYYLQVASAYADCLNKECSDKLNTGVIFTQTQVHTPRPLGRVDAASAVVDTDALPTLDFMQDFCAEDAFIDFKTSLIDVAREKFAYTSSFNKEYDSDISKLFDKPYRLWENVYLECLVVSIVQALRVKDRKRSSCRLDDITDFESINFLRYANEHNALTINITNEA